MGKSFALSLYGEVYDTCFLSARLADMRIERLFTVTVPIDTPHINKSFLTLPSGIAGGQGLGKLRTERT